MIRLLLTLLLTLPVCAHAACPPAHRSAAVASAFQRRHPCPSTGRTTGACPGYVKDHRVALCAGGADTVANLTWQTRAAAAAKDRQERAQCHALWGGRR